MASRLSPAKRRCYRFILKYKAEHDGNSPTIREIGEGCGVSSTSTVRFHLIGLERMGLIRSFHGANKTRKIEVVGGEWLPPRVREFSDTETRKLLAVVMS
jgi:SOS-response transcriptional repressors (RecA-mediated autopeptidases)